MKMHSLFLFAVSGLFVSCSSLSLYKDSDCDIPPEQYGQCYADLGYRPQAYETLAKFCEERGRPSHLEKFRNARSARLIQQCAVAEEVFALEFRSRAGLNGPETCPEALLNTEALRKAAKDGREAGTEYKWAKTEIKYAEEAEQIREKADSHGPWNGLANRLFQPDPEKHYEGSRVSSARSKSLRAQYPQTTALTERLKCTPGGWF